MCPLSPDLASVLSAPGYHPFSWSSHFGWNQVSIYILAQCFSPRYDKALQEISSNVWTCFHWPQLGELPQDLVGRGQGWCWTQDSSKMFQLNMSTMLRGRNSLALFLPLIFLYLSQALVIWSLPLLKYALLSPLLFSFARDIFGLQCLPNYPQVLSFNLLKFLPFFQTQLYASYSENKQKILPWWFHLIVMPCLLNSYSAWSLSAVWYYYSKLPCGVVICFLFPILDI